MRRGAEQFESKAFPPSLSDISPAPSRETTTSLDLSTSTKNADPVGCMGKWRNKLIYGDNLSRIRECVAPASVDLVYLDPPFNSSQNYNVLFSEKDGSGSASQRRAFRDTWKWDSNALAAYEMAVESGPTSVTKVMQAFRAFLDRTDMLAYLSMMAPRLVELRHVLKETGSLYLHCDPGASHYLKLLLDAVFGGENFRNEIIWKRTSAHNSARRFGPVHDVLLYYGRSDKAKWNPQLQAYDPAHSKKFNKIDDGDDRPFQDQNLTGPGTRTGPSGQSWRGFDPTTKGRHWQLASYLYKKYESLTGRELKDYPLIERLDLLDKAGLIYWPKKQGGFPRYKQYLDGAPGVPLQDVWTDIDPLNSQAKERKNIGYPTQKPTSLLKRILLASSNEGDLILDPFCGCGTAIEVAEELHRRWIGIDITQAAIKVVKGRLEDRFPGIVYDTSQSEPYSLADAQELAESDPYEFQWWIIPKVGCEFEEKKKGADRGIDGRLFFHDQAEETHQIVCSVKAGQPHVHFVRDLRGVVEREKAAIGVLILMHDPTGPMVREATDAGFFRTKWGEQFPKLQLLTVEQIMGGAQIQRPQTSRRVATRALLRSSSPAQIKLFR